MAGELHIRATTGSYAVFRGSHRVGGFYHNRERAEANLEAERKRDKVRERPCLCCGKPFRSEGIHHRMCAICRTRTGGMD